MTRVSPSTFKPVLVSGISCRREFFPYWIDIYLNIQSYSGVRDARPGDRLDIIELSMTCEFTHRHLDWRKPLDWLDQDPFLIDEDRGKVTAVMACPENPPNVAWIRYFCVSESAELEDRWQRLWSAAKEKLALRGIQKAVILPQDTRFEEAVKIYGAIWINHVISYRLDHFSSQECLNYPGIKFRKMSFDDLHQVESVDRASFELIWQLPIPELVSAFTMSEFSTVAEKDGQIVGYTMATKSQSGCHLARLAVHPKLQARGIGKALVIGLMTDCQKAKINHITVNTQSDNIASRSVYSSLGFVIDKGSYPVYHLMTGDS